MKKLWLIIFTGFFTGCGFESRDLNVRFNPEAEPFTRLSEYQLFTGNLANLEPNDRVLPYDLNSPLFSDYAEKLRFIWMPDSTSGIFNDSTHFDLPLGTVLIKNFYYPDDFRQPESDRRLLETRLLVHTHQGWKGLPYIWNDEQTEAYLHLAGGEKDVQIINKAGNKIEFRYLIPNVNQCRSCHEKNGVQVPIGPAARHLNRNFEYQDGMDNQLTRWVKHGLIDKTPDPGRIEKLVDFRNPDEDLNLRARSYLDINCGHCHNPGGPGNSSGLFLNFTETNPTSLGIMKPPVAAGRGSGGKSFSIVPGRPDDSILLYRMESTEPGILMPELGRTLVDEEGIVLIREWIKEMTAQDL
jgi:uncharacterized repeat protein (TIGR03806 family)